MRVAGVDYSTKAVHGAIVDGKQLVFMKRYDLGTNDLDVISLLCRDLQERDVEQVFLEQPFFIPARLDAETGKIKQGSNVNTLKLHAEAERVHTLLRLGGFRVFHVAPATWQSQMLKHVPGETRKKQSLWLASRMYGLELRDDNMADAICIATYGSALERFNGLIPQ